MVEAWPNLVFEVNLSSLKYNLDAARISILPLCPEFSLFLSSCAMLRQLKTLNVVKSAFSTHLAQLHDLEARRYNKDNTLRTYNTWKLSLTWCLGQIGPSPIYSILETLWNLGGFLTNQEFFRRLYKYYIQLFIWWL